MTDCELIRQLRASGYLVCFNRTSLSADGLSLTGNVDPSLVDLLKQDTKFLNGNFYGLHRDVGADLIDFRSIDNAFGPGSSLQLVISQVNGDCYADLDLENPYQDVASNVAHNGRIIWKAVKAVGHLFRRKQA